MSTLAIDATVLGALIGVVGVVIGAIVTTWLGGKVALSAAREGAQIQKKDHRDSRFWELRREGYGVVLYKLGEASKYADWLDNGYNNGHGGGAHVFHASKRREEYEEKTSKAWAECQSVFAKSHLIFSKPFITAFRRLRSSFPDEIEVASPLELAAREAKCFRDGQAELLGIAQAEVGFTETEDAQGTKSCQA